jgi:serine/threonine protein kinase/tetratricopeptide (TPR) repeat protein
MMNDRETLTGTVEALPADEQERLAQILDDYLVAVERGAPITPEELLRRHPTDAKYLRSYLSGLQLFHTAARGVEHGLAAATFTEGLIRPGQTIADFTLIREIGRGGMGVVYEALQTSLRRSVALKLLPFSSAYDAKQIGRFKNEAQAAAQVRHPNIVPVYAIGEDHGIHYYAMELIEGQSLAYVLGRLSDDSRSAPSSDTTVPNGTRTLQGQFLPPRPVAPRKTRPAPAIAADAAATADHLRTVATWGIQAASALHAAHDYGVIHRDVKPSNLLLDEAGKLWVTDFGLARCRETTNLTQSGDILGTMRYMSPEQALGRNALVDHRSDIYSLGVTLYELATLRHPADDVGDLQLFFDRTRSSYQPLRNWNRHIPRDFETVVMKAIAELPHERYATAEELADDLARFNAGQPIHATPPGLMTRASKWAKRHRGAVYASAAAAAVGIVALVVGLLVLTVLYEQKSVAIEALRTSEKMTRRNAIRAENNFKQARNVIDVFGAELAGRLAKIPGAEGLRLDLWKKTVKYYQDFIEQTRNDPTLDSDNPVLYASQALANSKIGELNALMGKKDEALAHHQKARSLWQRLLAGYPAADDIVEYRRNVALCDNNIGLLLVDLGRDADAVKTLSGAEDSQRQLLDADPQSTTLSLDLATTEQNLGYALRTTQIDQAASKLRDSIERLENLSVLTPKDESVLRTLAASYNNLASLEEPTDPRDASLVYDKAIAIQERLAKINYGYIGDLAKTFSNLGYLAASTGDWKTAEANYRRATELQEGLSKDSPSDAAVRLDLAITCNNLGMAQSQAKQFADAEASFLRARDLQQQLLAVQPEDVQNLSNLGGIYNNLAMLYDRQKHWEDAEAQYVKAIAYQRHAHDGAPASESVRDLLSKHLFNYARNLRQQGKPFAAADAALERKKLWPNQPDRLYSIAQDLTAACQAMDTPSQPARPTEQQQYWHAAVNTLREAVAAGLSVDRLNDPSLKALSSREDFQKLLAETRTNPAQTRPLN